MSAAGCRPRTPTTSWPRSSSWPPRRFGSVPAPPQDRLWLFGVARNSVADQHRSAQRRHRLHARLSGHALTRPAAVCGRTQCSEPVLAAISALRPRDRGPSSWCCGTG